MTPDGNLTRIALRPEPSAGSARLLGPSSLVSTITHYVPDAPRLASLKRLTRRLAQVAVPGLFLSLAACGGNMEEPKAQLNPNPKLKYALEIVLQDSPGPFDKLSALAQFDVVNATCVPEQPISGARITPRKRIPIDLSERKDGVYEGTFSLDAVLDANYHGLGVCHWTLTTVNISSEKGGTSFVINLTEEDIQSSRIEKRYFSRDSYDHPTSGFIDDGGTERVRVKHPETTFSMEAIARRVTP